LELGKCPDEISLQSAVLSARGKTREYIESSNGPRKRSKDNMICRTAIAILAFGLLLFGGRHSRLCGAENGASIGDKLNIASDGTAKATGVVLENNLGCKVDAECYLQLKIGDREIQVMYHPAEGPEPIKNRSAGDQGFSAKKGDRVAVHGNYRKAGTFERIETYSDEKFYIRILPR
jgi:hypothetical protein